MPTIPNSVTDRLSELRRWAVAHPHAAAGIAVVIVASLTVWLVVDTSDELSPDQVQAVRQFVLRTQAPAVRERFNDAIEDKRLTVNETKAVIEVAKKAEPEYGLASDQKIAE